MSSLTSSGKYRITLDELLMGRDTANPLTSEMRSNACKLLVALNFLRSSYGKSMVITSGYRPAADNTKAGGKPNSAHMTCEAADIRDDKGELKQYILANLRILDELDLYMEDPSATATWCHLQIRPTLSGKRVFMP